MIQFKVFYFSLKNSFNIIIFHLVVEQRQNNVGFPQGTILKRHRAPLPAPNDDRFFTYDQFSAGAEVSFYGRVYKLIDCDSFTRNLLTKLGVRVPRGMKRRNVNNFLKNFFLGYSSTEDPIFKHRQVVSIDSLYEELLPED
jgi:hypothetical protein